MNSLKMKRFRFVLIGCSIVNLVLLLALRRQLSAYPLLIVLLWAPTQIGILVYYFLQVREDIKRQMGIKLILLGSVSRMGYLVILGLIIAGGFVKQTNPQLAGSLHYAGIIVFALMIVASFMYQAGIRKWIAERRETANRSAEELSENNPAE